MPRARVHWFIILIYFIKSASSRKIKNFLIETEDYDRNTNVVPEGFDYVDYATKEVKHCKDVDWSFSNSPPFEHMNELLPQCGDKIRPEFNLLREKEKCSLDSCQDIQKCKLYEDLTEIIFVVHGFMSDARAMESITSLLLVDPSRAVVTVEYQAGSNPLQYRQIAANTRYMGVSLARKMLDLKTKLSSVKFHCVGHSLGAQICGFAGGAYHNISGTKLDRITGLDPAGPMFADDVPGLFAFKIKPAARLNKETAKFVDVIHTDGKMGKGELFQFGTMNRMGHLDFYAGTGGKYGWDMPCRPHGKDCSHGLAKYLFSSSITVPCAVLHSCTDPARIPQSCSKVSPSSEPVVMGYQAVPPTSGEHLYTVDITGKQPYCRNMKS